MVNCIRQNACYLRPLYLDLCVIIIELTVPHMVTRIILNDKSLLCLHLVKNTCTSYSNHQLCCTTFSVSWVWPLSGGSIVVCRCYSGTVCHTRGFHSQSKTWGNCNRCALHTDPSGKIWTALVSTPMGLGRCESKVIIKIQTWQDNSTCRKINEAPPTPHPQRHWEWMHEQQQSHFFQNFQVQCHGCKVKSLMQNDIHMLTYPSWLVHSDSLVSKLANVV